MASRWWACCVAASCLIFPRHLCADEVDDQLASIAAAGPLGAGSTAARAACDALSTRGADVLPRLLAAMETENPVAANWCRTAYEAIVDRELTAGTGRFPVERLRAYVLEPAHRGRARRLALELCDRLEPGYSKQVVGRMLDDPEFRDDAVEMALVAAEQAQADGDADAARREFRRAFDHSRASAQTARAAARLAALGEPVDVAAHLGLVVDWWLVGPFDAPGFSGFGRAFPPEEQVELQASYHGQDGRSIGWIRHRSADVLGLVNLAVALAPAREAVGYAYARLISPRDEQAELRCGADDNCTVWLNGKKVFAREQWLNGTRFDRFITPVRLRRGSNELLVKVCQGPPNKDPQVSNNWSLQLRFCDSSGHGLPLRAAMSEPTQTPKPER